MRRDLHVTGIQLKKLSNLVEKKALNPHCFCFDMLDTLDLKTSYYEESDSGQTIIAKKTPTKSMNSHQKQSGIHQR